MYCSLFYLSTFSRSTNNTRVERIWVEFGRHFARAWRGFFFRLEQKHRLDRTNPHHLWLLHFLFLNDINKDCDDFRTQWNAKPISGPDTQDKSPNVSNIDLCFDSFTN